MSKKKILLVVIPIILFILLVIFIRQDIIGEFEAWVYEESIAHMSQLLTKVLLAITHIGGTIGVIMICAAIFIYKPLREKAGIQVGTSVILAVTCNQILKYIFARERPDILRLTNVTNYSFPSGHAMVNMALYSILIIYSYRYIKSKRLKYTVIALLSLLIALIGFTRIYLGVHYAGDIIGGWLLGFAVSIGVYLFYSRIKPVKDMLEEEVE